MLYCTLQDIYRSINSGNADYIDSHHIMNLIESLLSLDTYESTAQRQILHATSLIINMPDILIGHNECLINTMVDLYNNAPKQIVQDYQLDDIYMVMTTDYIPLHDDQIVNSIMHAVDVVIDYIPMIHYSTKCAIYKLNSSICIKVMYFPNNGPIVYDDYAVFDNMHTLSKLNICGDYLPFPQYYGSIKSYRGSNVSIKSVICMEYIDHPTLAQIIDDAEQWFVLNYTLLRNMIQHLVLELHRYGILSWGNMTLSNVIYNQHNDTLRIINPKYIKMTASYTHNANNLIYDVSMLLMSIMNMLTHIPWCYHRAIMRLEPYHNIILDETTICNIFKLL